MATDYLTRRTTQRSRVCPAAAPDRWRADSSFLQGGYACPRAVGGPEIKENNMYPVSEHTVIGMKTDQNRYYYAGSTLAVQWTNQHGCGGNSNVNCEIVLQYMY